jgi:hypothetical protein
VVYSEWSYSSGHASDMVVSRNRFVSVWAVAAFARSRFGVAIVDGAFRV